MPHIINPYAAKLKATKATILQTQQAELLSLQRQAGAADYILTAALAAGTVAGNNLKAAQKNQAAKLLMVEKLSAAINDTDNLAAIATLASQNVTQWVTNAAVSAANVQVAATTVVKVASSIASINAIVITADSETRMAQAARDANKLIDETAYAAEVSSGTAMTMSALASQISAPTVADKAKAAQLAVDNLSTVANTDPGILQQVTNVFNANTKAITKAENDSAFNIASLAGATAASKHMGLLLKDISDQPNNEKTPAPVKTGMAEKKLAEINKLTGQVIDAQLIADQQQQIVNTLTYHANESGALLTVMDANKDNAFTQNNLSEAFLQIVLDLQENAATANNEGAEAFKQTKKLTADIKSTADRLALSADTLSNLSKVVDNMKVRNVLISPDLITMVKNAMSDMDNAVALIQVALVSSFTTFASAALSTKALALNHAKTTVLYKKLSGKKSLSACFSTAYANAKQAYEETEKKTKEDTKQLNVAVSNLSRAQIKLKSVQLGLDAAKAAALAG